MAIRGVAFDKILMNAVKTCLYHAFIVFIITFLSNRYIEPIYKYKLLWYTKADIAYPLNTFHHTRLVTALNC